MNLSTDRRWTNQAAPWSCHCSRVLRKRWHALTEFCFRNKPPEKEQRKDSIAQNVGIAADARRDFVLFDESAGVERELSQPVSSHVAC